MPACPFVIYGSALFGESGYESRVRAAASGLSVQFAGWVDDVYSAMSCLDVLLVPSAAIEGTTRVVLEAFAAGLPVIAYRSGGIKEVIEHGVNGLLVDSAEEMANECIELLRDPDRRAAIAGAARKTWQRGFTLARYQEEMLTVIQSLVAA